MLELKRITKVYNTGGFKQKALDNVNLSFRKNEFTSILGPSGSGKTTLLNIIGGLDKYTSGDLIINGVSTKKYKDSNWDSYRNHRIGFVFQSYNLISHQTILQNVVLALKLSGISKNEAIKRAKDALNEVGLKEHINKKPSELSGGQMQRVAIARALVNDPDILLADEPTGALDSETSIQIMNLLKKIAKDKLVIMVTHNPELANEYSNRIITLKDGKITSDSNPFNEENEILDDSGKTNKTTMSFLTALSLSFNNLMTKKGRTILVSLAGSIGIIGIALILSLSTGFQNYIDKLQEDTLSSYPLTIYEENADMTQMLLGMMGSREDDTMEDSVVYERQFVSSMFGNVSKNDLKNFKNYLETNHKLVSNDISSIHYGYSVSPQIYSKYNKKVVKLNPSNLFSSFGNSIYSNYSNIYNEMTDDIDMLDEQFDVLAGSWPKNYDELIIVLSEPHTISDMLVYYLGLRDPKELSDMISKMMAGETVEIKNEPYKFTYNELMELDLRLVLNPDVYKYNSKYKIYEDMAEDEKFINDLYDKGLKLKIVGIVVPKNGTNSMALQNGIAYTSNLTKYIIENSKNSEIVNKQLNNKDIDVFSNTKFDEKENKSNLDFEDLIKIDRKMLESAFDVKIDEKTIKNLTTDYMKDISASITTDTSGALNDFETNLKTIASNLLNNYIENPKETIGNMPVIYNNDVDDIVNNYMNSDSVNNMLLTLENKYFISSKIFKSTYSSLINGLIKGYIVVYNMSDTTYTTDTNNQGAVIVSEIVNLTVENYIKQDKIKTISNTFATNMTEALMQGKVATKVMELTGALMSKMASAFNVDPEKIAGAFKFDLSEDELKRIMSAMNSNNGNKNLKANLITLGYQDLDEPSSISFYFKSFNSKENFIDFIENYNKKQESSGFEDKKINYTDTTGILMGSVKKIVNSVSYVLIAFVSISLVVSSIMIGIITYISVIERTKEIGILRAIGASKRNISSIFNAETFIIGLLSGCFGIGITLTLIPIINSIIHKLTDNTNISASISISASIVLIILSIILTLIGGLIPSRKAAKQDPVVALRSE